jgi:hypothetical protein
MVPANPIGRSLLNTRIKILIQVYCCIVSNSRLILAYGLACATKLGCHQAGIYGGEYTSGSQVACLLTR